MDWSWYDIMMYSKRHPARSPRILCVDLNWNKSSLELRQCLPLSHLKMNDNDKARTPSCAPCPKIPSLEARRCRETSFSLYIWCVIWGNHRIWTLGCVFLYNGSSDCRRFLIVTMKHHDQKQIGKVLFGLHFYNVVHYWRKLHRNSAEQKPGDRSWCRGRGWVLFTVLVNMVCSACFLIEPRPPAQEWHPPNEQHPPPSISS